MALDPTIWGPHYWFVLHTIALSYPNTPNETTKKKYYDFIQNIPLFIPVSEIGNSFSTFLDKYPVTPYLDSRESFVKWMHFIHNKINIALGYQELTMDEAMSAYYEHYKPKAVVSNEHRVRREKIAFGCFIITIIICGGVLYKK
tara:strand:+ start:1076 stop:1507 length:432 start_codon:yes stop_codon:yes gene_type:complete